MARYQITGTAEYGAMLRMSKINGFGGRDFQPFTFDTMAEARAFYDAEKVEPYEETIQTMVAPQTMGDKTVTKYFRKGGPLEMMLPFDEDQWVDGSEGRNLSVTGHGAIEGLIKIEVINKCSIVIDIVEKSLQVVNILEHFLETEIEVEAKEAYEKINILTGKLFNQIDDKEHNKPFRLFVNSLQTIIFEREYGTLKDPSGMGRADSVVSSHRAIELGRQFIHTEMTKITTLSPMQRFFINKFFNNETDVDVLFDADVNESAATIFPETSQRSMSYFYKPIYVAGKKVYRGSREDNHEKLVPLTVGELRTELLLDVYAHHNGMNAKTYYEWAMKEKEKQ